MLRLSHRAHHSSGARSAISALANRDGLRAMCHRVYDYYDKSTSDASDASDTAIRDDLSQPLLRLI